MALRDFYSSERPFDATRSPPLREASATNLLVLLWRRKGVILAVVLACLACGVGYILATPSRYLASATILIDPRLGKVVGSDPVQPGFITDSGAIESQIKLFTSQTVLARVAKMAHLADDPEFNGSQRSLLDRLLRPSDVPPGSVDLKALENAITVKRPERTYIVQIDVLARSAAKSALIANDVVQAYIDDQIASRVDAAQGDSQYVRNKLDRLSSEIRAADEKIEAYKRANNIVDTAGLRTNEQQITDVTRSLAEARAKTSDAKARLDEVERLARSGHLDAIAPALNSLTVERLRQQQAEAEQTEARDAETLGPRHPALLEAKARVAKTNRLVRDELKRLEIGAREAYAAAKMIEDSLAAQVDALKHQSTQMSEKLVPLDQLQRNASVLRSNFSRFSQVNDSLAQQEADSPPGRVVSAARPPVSPARPKKTLALAISLAAGLCLGIAAAILVEGTSARPETDEEPRYPRPPAPVPAPSPVAASPRAAPRRRYWDDDV